MDVFFIIERHADMGDTLAPEEDQVPLAHLFTFDTPGQRVVLLVGIARDDIATHTIAKLDEAAAIDASPACAAPEIGHAEKGAGVSRDDADRLSRIGRRPLAHADSVARDPGGIA